LSFEITPEPDDAVRRAILAALADEEAERSAGPRFGADALSTRDWEEDEP
jgi:hypothetical protein